MRDSSGKTYQQSADIDVVGLSSIDKAMVVGECKFRNEKIDKSIYDVLVRRSKAISTKYELKKYLLFSLGGYTEWFDGSDEMLCLFTLDDLFK